METCATSRYLGLHCWIYCVSFRCSLAKALMAVLLRTRRMAMDQVLRLGQWIRDWQMIGRVHPAASGWQSALKSRVLLPVYCDGQSEATIARWSEIRA